MSEQDQTILDFGSIDFTPEWARKSAGVTVTAGRGGLPQERGQRDSRDFTKAPRRDFPRKNGDKKPFAGRADKDRSPRFAERVKPLDAEVKILPETKALGTIIRKLQQDTHAYKLKDLAYFFLDNPQSILLKITPKGEVRFHQCKVCGFASTKPEEISAHAVSAHLGEYYDCREVECEPPKGNFSCVARCSLSGELLGPPNEHGFKSRIAEMLRRYPGMGEEEYRSRIEMVRDSEVIEQWRRSSTRKTVYTSKSGGAELTRDQAEAEFKRNFLSSLVDSPRNLMITADIAVKSPEVPLKMAVESAIAAERRNPYNMCFALRGAFHHRKLKFFRANDARGPEFVTSVEYRPFDSAHAIPELAGMADFIAANPCCDKSELTGGEEALKHLEWLVSTGHVVSFTNGVYSAVEKYPKYGPQWKKRAGKNNGNKEEVKTEAEAKVAEVKEEEKKDEAAPQLAQ